MATAPHPDLDLTQTIRPGLDILASEIVIALKKRTRFVQNTAIYSPGLVLTDPAQTLLSYVLRRVEGCHAELGRYTYAVQDAYSNAAETKPVIDRAEPHSPVLMMPSRAGSRIVEFYRQWILRACSAGSVPDSYGESVTSDVTALLAIMERVNLGKSVAEAKFLEKPQQFKDTGGDRNAMLALIVRADREEKVLNLARKLARHYEIAEEHTVDVFEFMIATTKDIEVDYLRQRAGCGVGPQ